MIGAFYIFIAMVVIGIVLYVTDVLYFRKKYPENKQTEFSVGDDESDSNAQQVSADNSVCCGMHTVCEKTNLSPVTGEIVYYDDEELDRFRGRDAGDYSPEEVEEFRDVLMTLLPEDVAGWSRSIQVREITLPIEIRDELLMIVSDLRQ